MSECGCCGQEVEPHEHALWSVLTVVVAALVLADLFARWRS